MINDSIVKDNYTHTLNLIKNSLPRDEKLIVIDQNAYIYHNELKSLKIVKNFESLLLVCYAFKLFDLNFYFKEKDVITIEDIKDKIRKSNLILENALNSKH